MSKAFTVQEQAAIVMTTVDNGKSQGNNAWSTSGGQNTQDKVFLLSHTEASKYFSNNQARMCAPTDYAIKNGAWTSSSYSTAEGKAIGWWWLRSPGSSSSSAADVGSYGALGDRGVSNNGGIVRPAFWLNLESGIY